MYFYDKCKDLPSDAIYHRNRTARSVQKNHQRNTGVGLISVTLIKKDSNDTNLDNFLSAIATLYELGLNPSIENLYPKVEFPVSRSTPSIGSLMKWDHSENYPFRRYPDDYNQSTASDMNVTIDLMLNEGGILHWSLY